MKKIVTFVENNHLRIFSLLLFFSLLPIVISQGKSYITIHDNLDSEIPIRVVLARSGTMFADQGEVEQIMNGLPRNTMPSGMNVVMLLFWLFPPLTAYIINYILVHVIAFIGMYLLLRVHVIKEDNLITSGVAFCFSFLPFYTIYGLSIAGLPLLLYAILDIRNQKKFVTGYLLILFFPLYSSLIYVGIFILISLVIWLVIDLFRKKPVRSFLIAILLLGASYGFVEHSLILSQLELGGFLSHRSEWSSWASQKSVTLSEALELSLSNFSYGQYHAVSLHSFILAILVPVTLIYMLISRRQSRLLIGLLYICALFSLSVGFSNWIGWIPIKERVNLINEIQIRFYWLNPVLWYIIFALALNIFLKNRSGTSRVITVAAISLCLVGQMIYIGVLSPEFAKTLTVALDSITGKQNRIITYDEFYSIDLFENIQADINKPQSSYRTVSIGIHPGIAQYNGFYTLDSYQNNYALEYKEIFRKVISAELEKSPNWEYYFDSWGNRCYIFSEELDSYLIPKSESHPIHHLELDSAALSDLAEGKDVYVFSAVEILNFEENLMEFLDYYENSESPWGIYLYKMIAD